MIPAAVREAIEQKFGLATQSFTPVSGGCINHGGKFTASQGTFFIKWKSATKYPGMFRAEASGLEGQVLRRAG